MVSLGDTVEVNGIRNWMKNVVVFFRLKQCKANPWTQFADTHNKGDKVTGKIKSITDFGIFIGLEGVVSMV